MSESAEEAKRPPADKTGNWVESLAGLLIWVVLGIVAVLWYWRSNNADILFDVAQTGLAQAGVARYASAIAD